MKRTWWLMAWIVLVAGASSAQSDALPGDWESARTTDDSEVATQLRLGTAGDAHVELDGLFSQAFLAASEDEDVQQLADIFPDGLRIQIVADGTWEAGPDSLRLLFAEPGLLVNGDTFEAFIFTIATSLAATTIKQLGLPAEQEPTVVATFVGLLSQDLTEEDVTSQAFPDDGSPTAYRMDDQTLVMTDADGETSRWHRRTESVVVPAGWGQTKRDLTHRR
ncbi:MAG: hypothetical protein HN712_10095 [Gemmatimonadetes bacterium]|jgi:hypothetical protein|nr:hypothetical protein [Gemmatimonadota bacterium]MBT6146386.1 hypothetical protein [Gemmatimonadota bacterium]MBT7860653.1 hypothetical protein [Gemmatimonadota bacterium]